MPKRRNHDVRDCRARHEEDDGLDPRLDELRDRADARRESRPSHRDAQLAKVALRLLEQDLCSLGPAIAAGLHLLHVEVLAAGAHLRVYTAPDHNLPNPAALTHWLTSITPALRASLARSLARKRVPTITLILTDPLADAPPGPYEGPHP